MGLRDQMWQVIEWKDDSSDTIVYRFPHKGKEIMSGSQLTVRESQVAVFVHLGQIADVFTPGKYKLETKNLPILTAITNLLYRGHESRFKAEVYFVNVKQFLGQKWGTQNPITLRDKDFGVVRIRGFGQFGFKVRDAAVFMRELFGTNSKFTTEDIVSHLRSVLIGSVTDAIAESQVSALDIAANQKEFSQTCLESVREDFNAIGIDITSFIIENVSFPENVEKAIDERTSLGILSDKMGTYAQKKAADALGDAAKNSGTVGTFIGMGMGQSAGGALGGAFSNLSNAKDKPAPETPAALKHCSACGKKIDTAAKFCPECGAPLAAKGVCANCGAPLAEGAKFCAECGKKV